MQSEGSDSSFCDTNLRSQASRVGSQVQRLTGGLVATQIRGGVITCTGSGEEIIYNRKWAAEPCVVCSALRLERWLFFIEADRTSGWVHGEQVPPTLRERQIKNDLGGDDPRTDISPLFDSRSHNGFPKEYSITAASARANKGHCLIHQAGPCCPPCHGPKPHKSCRHFAHTYPISPKLPWFSDP